VSHDHLADLDLHGDLLDVFDVVRLVRRTAWGEPVPFDARLRGADVIDAQHAAAALLRPRLGDAAETSLVRVDSDESRARLTFADGSIIVIPRQWSGRITDLTIGEGIAAGVMTSTRSIRGLDTPARRLGDMERCERSVEVGVNQVFYRREPHMMRRYTALAMDNIRRDPRAFLMASAYRAVRLFIIEGASDSFTAQQFSRSGRIYAAGTAASVVFLVLSVAGIAIGWRRGDRIGLPLLLIVSVPATLAPVLINMRYTITIQPLMFIFVAIAITAVMSRGEREPVAVSSPSAR
jgi:hypothetical protein